MNFAKFKINKNQRVLWVAVLIAAGVVIFQNCGEVQLIKNDLASFSTTSTSSTTTTTVVTSTTMPTSTTVLATSTTISTTPTTEYFSPLPTPPPVMLPPPSSGSWCNGASFYPQLPPGIPAVINYKGINYDLRVIGSAYNGGCQSTVLTELDPLNLNQRMDIRFWSVAGIYALRFRTPANVVAWYQFQFLLDAGIAQGQAGARYSISRTPGEFHDDGRLPSTNYCDFGNNNNAYSYITARPKPGNPTACYLAPNTYYYYNVLVLDIPGQSQGALNNSDLGGSGALIDCASNPIFPYCNYVY